MHVTCVVAINNVRDDRCWWGCISFLQNNNTYTLEPKKCYSMNGNWDINYLNIMGHKLVSKLMFPAWKVSIISKFSLMIIWCPFAHRPSPSERLMLILPQCSYPHCNCRCGYHYSMCLCIGSLCIIIYRVCIVCQVSYEISNPRVISLLSWWSLPETWNLQRTTNLYTIKPQAKQCPC